VRPQLDLKHQYHNLHRVEDLLEEYNFDPDQIQTDAASLCESRYRLTASEQDRVVAFMRDERLRAYVTSHSASQLLVHGRSKSLTLSATSVVCARLFQVLHRSAEVYPQQIIPLGFFCGQHIRSDDFDAHPPGALLNLLLQLVYEIQRQNIPINSAEMQTELESLHQDDIESIAQLMANVVDQLPEHSLLYLIIDGVSFYEDSSRYKEMKKMVSMLLNMGASCRRPVFKLLMSAPGSTLYAWEIFKKFQALGEAEIIDVYGSYQSKAAFATLDLDLPGDGEVFDVLQG
jgi:hypothetical protein